ncbi:MAG: hypothetical protein GY756_21235 [bacterium]|nr:hypothetical protein [bacterium]
MEKEEAIKQIELINNVIESSNNLFFSGRKLIILGIIVLFIAPIEYFTEGLSFGVHLLSKPAINTILQIVFYFLIYYICVKVCARDDQDFDKTPKNPVLLKALGIHDTIILTMFGTIIVLTIIGRGELIFPIVYLFIGMLFDFFGRFTTKIIIIISRSYIILGLIFLGLTHWFGMNYLWIFFTVYMSITYIIMGVSLIKNRR